MIETVDELRGALYSPPGTACVKVVSRTEAGDVSFGIQSVVYDDATGTVKIYTYTPDAAPKT